LEENILTHRDLMRFILFLRVHTQAKTPVILYRNSLRFRVFVDSAQAATNHASSFYPSKLNSDLLAITAVIRFTDRFF